MTNFLIVLLCFAFSTLHAQQLIQFQPTSYSNKFSSALAPVLKINSGDTVATSSADAIGIDKNGNRVANRGNPLTGPFYIEGASRGDVLAITLHSVQLNRNYATTLNALIPKLLPKSIAMKTWRSAKLVKWHLDLEQNTGTPPDSLTRLKNLKIPLHAFLGCVGVASDGNKPANTGASGAYGGNMDWRYATSGATVFLPVFHEGALLYLGDGHAAQGDGELNGDALETSMNFSFSVQVLKKSDFPLETPMMENADYLMFFGIESSLDQALKTATTHLQNWLQKQYALSLAEISQVVGPAIEYRIPKIAASKVEIVAMIPKKLLTSLIQIQN